MARGNQNAPDEVVARGHEGIGADTEKLAEEARKAEHVGSIKNARRGAGPRNARPDYPRRSSKAKLSKGAPTGAYSDVPDEAPVNERGSQVSQQEIEQVFVESPAQGQYESEMDRRRRAHELATATDYKDTEKRATHMGPLKGRPTSDDPRQGSHEEAKAEGPRLETDPDRVAAADYAKVTRPAPAYEEAIAEMEREDGQ